MSVTGNIWPWNFILFFATLNSCNRIMVLSNTLKVLGKGSYRGRYLQMVSCCMTLSSYLISSLIRHTHYFWTRLNIPPSGSKCISCVWFADTVKERLASYISNPGYEMGTPALVFFSIYFPLLWHLFHQTLCMWENDRREPMFPHFLSHSQRCCSSWAVIRLSKGNKSAFQLARLNFYIPVYLQYRNFFSFNYLKSM